MTQTVFAVATRTRDGMLGGTMCLLYVKLSLGIAPPLQEQIDNSDKSMH